MDKYIRNEYGYLVPNPNHPDFKNKKSKNDLYWDEIQRRKEQRQDWENRNEPIGF